MDLTRKVFFGVIASIATIGGGIAYGIYANRAPVSVTPRVAKTAIVVAEKTAVSAPTATARIDAAEPTVAKPTLEVEATAVPAGTLEPTAVPESSLKARLKPIWGKNYRAEDGLDTVVCGAYAFSADYVLQQMQVSGLDVKNGFHLGIVPFYLNEQYFVTAKDRTEALRDGTLDCLLTTFDLMALEDPGVLTAFINESAGGDQLWSRGLSSLNDLKGKRIAFEANGPSAYFVYDLLSTVQLTPKDVVLLPQPSQNDAIEVFNKNEADAVAGWEPVIFGAKKGGGTPLATSKEFRSILGGIVMSPAAIANKRSAIQAFHEAWFAALDVQEADFGKASQQIAKWGNNVYLGVSATDPEKDMRVLLGGVAQASLADNVRAFSDLPIITRRLQQARGLWALNGHTVPSTDISSSGRSGLRAWLPAASRVSTRRLKASLSTTRSRWAARASHPRRLRARLAPRPHRTASRTRLRCSRCCRAGVLSFCQTQPSCATIPQRRWGTAPSTCCSRTSRSMCR